MPKDFKYIIDELLYKMQSSDKNDYYDKILENIIELGAGEKFKKKNYRIIIKYPQVNNRPLTYSWRYL